MAQEGSGETTGSISPSTSSIEKDTNAVTETKPKEPTDSGMILVSKVPIEVRAHPSSSASVMYGFPPGRRFRLIGQESGFAEIQDLRSGATGWIDETTLGNLPGESAASVPSKPKPDSHTQKETTASVQASEAKPAPRKQKVGTASVEPKPKTITKRHVTATQQHPVQNHKRHGIFGLRHNGAQGVLY
jgi:hypothetical protein